MTSPQYNEYWDYLRVTELSKNYYKIIETPLATVIDYYYDLKENNHPWSRMFQVYWLIHENKFHFNYAIRITDNSICTFNQICMHNELEEKNPIVAEWYTGKLSVQIAYKNGYVDEHAGSFPDISTIKIYEIKRGLVTKVDKVCILHDAMPF